MKSCSPEALLAKYNVAAPRYTSYPTVPQWDADGFSEDHWKGSVRLIFKETNAKEGMALYIHLPYCESLCTYCGCNTRITVNHAVEEPYIHALLSEWDLYLSIFPAPPRISEIHLGGGTPTFFSAENLVKLIRGIKEKSVIMPDCAMSFEAHPANTSVDHLQALYDEGFRRLSLGIQDFDAKVQDAIHRFQSVQQVEYITLKAREIGFVGINYDLVYGLPFQNIQGLSKTLEEVIRLKPDRIAFYSYAHVPWLKPRQRKYTELDLPDASLKMELYHLARNKFEYHGYLDVGMDHFALAHDDLAIAYLNHSLHRNFMGYTDRHTRLLIGLGTSSISDSWYAFAQNEKTVEQYLERVTARKLPVFKGHLLNREDLIIRRHILNIMCKGETHWDHFCTDTDAIHQAIPVWREMEQEGLLHLSSHGLKVSKSGMNFLRNICMALDARHHRALSSSPKYSRAI